MTSENHQPVVFLDRDGTIIEEVGHLHRPEQVRFIPGALEALQRLKAAGYRLVAVSNQSGVALGLFTEQDVREVNDFIQDHLKAHNAGLDAWYWSPFHPQGTVAPYNVDSPLRKPATGMIEKAVCDLGLSLAGGWMVGDKWSDVLCGWRAGLRSILVLTGYGREQWLRVAQSGEPIGVLTVAGSLADAADWILKCDGCCQPEPCIPKDR
ncbi:MAG: D-glycero-beta-D-manno-heptose 1,7-bisphosphate 7-phosphatase [Candidatus Sumerlaeia bacterium]